MTKNFGPKGWIVALVLTVFVLTGCLAKPIADVKPELPAGEFMFMYKIGPASFKEFYTFTDSGRKHYTILLNTRGGEAQATTGIISRILELKKKGVTFTTVVYSKAFSAGSFIYMMGDYRIMHQGACLMFHTMRGQYAASKKTDAIPLIHRLHMDTLDDNIIRLAKRQFPNVNPMTLETILEHSGETYITAKEAHSLGMVDELVEN